MSALPLTRAFPGAQRSAWIVIDDKRQAQAIADALAADGWQVCGVASGLAAARRLLAATTNLPDVVVSGLRFADGDGLQLMRALAKRPHAPAMFIASRQQRAVIKGAAALAEACGLPLAGIAEQPVEAATIARALAEFAGRRAAAPREARPPLKRAQLLAMLESDALRPWLQPKMRIDTREVVGFEALMRACDDDGQLILPDQLIGALAMHDLLDEATLRMARQTVEFVAACLGEGMAISASINVSMQSLTDLMFCHELAAAVEQFGLDPSWITIEITESDAMADPVQVIENATRIRLLGFNLAIDDLGTGWSSMDQLTRIPFSELKIERTFTSGVERDRGKRAIVRACAQLGTELGLSVVAEGVETLAELDFVAHAGCTQVQGYLVARAMPAPAALAWLRGLDELRFELPAR